MADLSIAQLLSLIQENIQRSYEYVEETSAIARSDGEYAVALAVESLELELPIDVSLVEVEQDPRDFIKQTEGMNAFQVASLLIDSPNFSPDYRAKIKNIARLTMLEEIEAQPDWEEMSKDPDVPTDTKDASERTQARTETLRGIQTEIAQERAAAIDSLKTRAKHFDARIRLRDQKSDLLNAAKLTVRFKPTLK